MFTKLTQSFDREIFTVKNTCNVIIYDNNLKVVSTYKCNDANPIDTLECSPVSCAVDINGRLFARVDIFGRPVVIECDRIWCDKKGNLLARNGIGRFDVVDWRPVN